MGLIVFGQIGFAQVETDFSSGGALRVGDSSTGCTSAISGAIRFNDSGSDTLDYCDGSSWLSLDTGGIPSAVLNNGNSFAAPMVIGTNDNQPLSLQTNGSNSITIGTTGNVGIGSDTPQSTLEVSGSFRNTASILNSTAIIDFATSNQQYTASDCDAFVLHNLKDGGTYTLAVQGTTSALCVFTAFSDAGTTALTVHMPFDHAATTAGEHTVYTFMVMGTHVYVFWVPEFS